jgi:hypothetical protein
VMDAVPWVWVGGAKPLEKRDALSDHQRRIGLCGVTPLMYQYDET